MAKIKVIPVNTVYVFEERNGRIGKRNKKKIERFLDEREMERDEMIRDRVSYSFDEEDMSYDDSYYRFRAFAKSCGIENLVAI